MTLVTGLSSVELRPMADCAENTHYNPLALFQMGPSLIIIIIILEMVLLMIIIIPFSSYFQKMPQEAQSRFIQPEGPAR